MEGIDLLFKFCGGSTPDLQLMLLFARSSSNGFVFGIDFKPEGKPFFPFLKTRSSHGLDLKKHLQKLLFVRRGSSLCSAFKFWK